MSLADQIIASKNSAPTISTDELGIPDEKKTVDYYALRAIKLNPYLHTYDGLLLNGHVEVSSKTSEIAVLTQAPKITGNMAALVYARLFSLVPKLDESCIAITPHLLWHKDTGELEETEDEIPVDSPWD